MTDDRSDDGRSTPSVPGSGAGDDDTDETTDAGPEDGPVLDPAGVGGDPPNDDSSGLSGQPNADDVPADWSDVDDSADASPPTPREGSRSDPTPVDAETHVDAGAGAAPQGGGSNRVDTGAQTGGEAGTGGQRGPDEKFCSNCGAVIDQQAVVCPECGVEQAGAQRQGGGSNDAGVAALLAVVGFVVPILAGAGQFYNGDIGKGIIFTVIQLLNVGLAFLLVGLLTYPLVSIVAIWDAYSSANR
jgi:TM2 domain-containing membrane protein YozV